MTRVSDFSYWTLRHPPKRVSSCIVRRAKRFLRNRKSNFGDASDAQRRLKSKIFCEPGLAKCIEFEILRCKLLFCANHNNLSPAALKMIRSLLSGVSAIVEAKSASQRLVRRAHETRASIYRILGHWNFLRGNDGASVENYNRYFRELSKIPRSRSRKDGIRKERFVASRSRRLEEQLVSAVSSHRYNVAIRMSTRFEEAVGINWMDHSVLTLTALAYIATGDSGTATRFLSKDVWGRKHCPDTVFAQLLSCLRSRSRSMRERASMLARKFLGKRGRVFLDSSKCCRPSDRDEKLQSGSALLLCFLLAEREMVLPVNRVLRKHQVDAVLSSIPTLRDANANQTDLFHRTDLISDWLTFSAGKDLVRYVYGK